MDTSGERSFGIHIYYLSENNNATGNVITTTGFEAFGILMERSSNNDVVGNDIVTSGDKGYGILIDYSSDNLLADNVIDSYADAILSDSSANTTATGNDLAADTGIGFFLASSTNFDLSGNTMTDCGIMIEGELPEHWNTHYISTTNTVSGKAVRYYKDSSTVTVPGDAGQVILANCNDMTVSGQTLNHGAAGILMGFTSDSLIENNTCTENQNGIIAYGGSGNHFINNIVSLSTGDGIRIEGSDYNNFKNNTCSNNGESGIRAVLSDTNIFRNNTLSDNSNGIFLDDSKNNSLINNNCSSNTNCGIYLSWTNEYTYLNMNDCSDNDWCGIELDSAFFTVLVNNTCNRNEQGIRLFNSGNNQLSGNTASFNGDGIFLDGNCDNNVMVNNSMEGNTYYGIYIRNNTAENNIIHHNNFTDNNEGDIQAYDNGTGNDWDDGNEGNYWSDLTARYPNSSKNGTIWNTSYDLDGPAGAADDFPVISFEAQNITQPPVNETLPVTAIAGLDRTIDEGGKIDFDGTGSTGNGVIINYTWRFVYNGTEIILYGPKPVFVFGIPGNYTITLTVTDALNITATDTINITVLEVIVPDKNLIGEIEVEEGEVRFLRYEDPNGGLIDLSVSGNGTLIATRIENDTDEVGGDPNGYLRISFYLKLTFQGVMNWTNITISFAELALNGSANYSRAAIFYFDGLQWREAENTGIDMERQIVWANVTHFTIFATFAPVSGGGDDDDVGDDDDDGTGGAVTEESWYQSTGVMVMGLIILIVLVMVGVFFYARGKGEMEEEEPEEGQITEEKEGEVELWGGKVEGEEEPEVWSGDIKKKEGKGEKERKVDGKSKGVDKEKPLPEADEGPDLPPGPPPDLEEKKPETDEPPAMDEEETGEIPSMEEIGRDEDIPPAPLLPPPEEGMAEEIPAPPQLTALEDNMEDGKKVEVAETITDEPGPTSRDDEDTDDDISTLEALLPRDEITYPEEPPAPPL